jgi:hypothetical protein
MIDASGGDLSQFSIDQLCATSKELKANHGPERGTVGLSRDDKAILERIRANVMARSPECGELL